MQTFISCNKQRIDLDTIVWLEGDWNYTRIYQQNLPVSLSAYTLKWYERQLADFVRVRKDAMVNPRHICAVERISGRPRRLNVMLTNGKVLEVTRRRQGFVQKQLGSLPPLHSIVRLESGSSKVPIITVMAATPSG